MRRHVLRLRHLLFLLGLVVLASRSRGQTPGLEPLLRDKYVNKIVALRGFYSGGELRYDAAGATENEVSGDWTTDGFVQIQEIHVEPGRLLIKGKRQLIVSGSGQGFQFRNEPENKERKKASKYNPFLTIEAALAPGETPADAAEAALSKIFLRSQDDLADLVPNYWKPCVREGRTGKNQKCHFDEKLLAVPGIAGRAESSADADESPQPSKPADGFDGKPFKVGGGVKPPKVIRMEDPEFSEAARDARIEGTVVVDLIVNKEGLPRKIHVATPLGCGLDAKAVRAVETWQFQPAEKDGEPVSVAIAIEVQFALR